MGDLFVKKLYIFAGAVLFVVVLIGALWISAYNGVVTKENDVIQKRANVHATLSTRFDKMGTMIDAIESANTTVQGYLDTIMAARIAFANALADNDLDAIDASVTEINSTFIDLVSYVEDNPSSYNTTSLYANALAGFNTSTNIVLTAMIAYNEAVKKYNNHIKIFPNNIFVGSNSLFATYEVDNYNQTLPSFNS